MVVPVTGTQQQLLEQGSIEPTFLVRISSRSGSLYLCSGNAIEYAGTTYQPYLSAIGTLRTSASFPENHTTGKELPLEFENTQIELDGTLYPHLSQTFDVFDWELADVDVDVVLTASGTRSVSEEIAIPLVSSGIVGTPSEITRGKFLLPVVTRNIQLNDGLPLRVITQAEFLEADRDVLNGRTYLPIVVGSGVRITAPATGAGATTTVSEQVDSGTVLKVSETSGFAAGDSIIIGGFIGNPFTISTVDFAGSLFNLSTDLSTLGQTLEIGTVVREDKSAYDFTVANHECGEISQVFVTPRGQKDPVAISGSLFSKLTVDDPNAIGGKRTDVRISELVPFGQGGVTQQPDFSIPGGNHDHNVSSSLETTKIHLANSVSPGSAGAANDGSEDTGFTITAGAADDEVIYQSFSSVAGSFVEQRYFVTMQGPTVNGNIKIRRGTTSFLTLTSAFGKAEFRSAVDTGGSATTDFNVVADGTTPTQADVFEGWKEITLNPSVSEDLQDLSNTSRDADVKISGADIEVGDKVEVVIDGVPVPDDSGRFGEVTASGTAIQRPHGVMRWILEEVLGQTGIVSEDAYSAVAPEYEIRDTRLRFAIQRPMKLDALFDQIADNAQSLHFWGRDGHSIRFLQDLEEVGSPVAIFREDQHGVMTIDAQNTFSATDLRNELVAFFDRDWTQTANRDESYQGSVLGQDILSQERFGIRGNEVDGGHKTFFFDMIPSVSGAQATMDKLLGNKSFPKKTFTVETDWTYLNLEPGDVVEVNSDLLLAPVTARVIEHQVDPRLFCRVVSREIGSSVGSHYTSVETGILRNVTDNDIGIANAWTILYRFKRLAPITLDEQLFHCHESVGNANKIRFAWDATAFPNPRFEVEVWDSGGSNSKQWYWDDVLTGFVGEWHQFAVSWDGSEIKLYSGPIGSLSGPLTVDSKPSDDSVTQTSTDRRLTTAFSIARQNLYQIALWDRELSQAELSFLDQHVRHELTEDEGAYAGGANLQHWWRLCFDRSDIGKDYGISPTRIDINVDGFADEGDCRQDAPR